MHSVNIAPAMIRRLDGGLILRRSRAADAEKLAAFNSLVHADERVGAMTRDFLSGKHPTFGVDDFTIVENPETGEIISSMSLIDQTWTYAGVPFNVGRPELVGTRPDYRKRGLVRQQFEVIHEWSRQRGQILQAITGIPYYYRLFGYEMAMDLDGGRMAYASTLPKVKAGQPPAYRLRPAVAADIPFIADCYSYNCQRDLVACLRSEALWQYELLGKSPQNADRQELYMIESLAGEPTGFIAMVPYLIKSIVACSHFSLKPGASWWEITPIVLQFVWETGQRLATESGKPCDTLGMLVHENHPVFKVAGKRFWLRREAYAWYLRLPDLKGFLRLITPVLEKRLGESLCPGFSGALDLNLYQDGLRMVFEKGRLAGLEDWKSTPDSEETAAFPGQSFLQLLFGWRNLEELHHAFPDCWVAEDYAPVLEALFPRQNSYVWAVA